MYLIVDEELRLKILRPEDASALFALTDRNRDHLKEWLPWLNSTTEEAHTLGFIKMTMKQFGENNGVQLGIWYQEEIVGIIGHHSVDWPNKATTLGYWLGQEYGGRGIMTRACRALIDFSFDELKLNRLSISAATENKKSRAIPERLKLAQEGVLRQNEWLYDRFVDHVIYSVLASEWRS